MGGAPSLWSDIGPSNVAGLPGNVLPGGGRIDGIDVSPDYDGAGHSAMFLAMPGGGVWRSADFQSATPTWIPLTDHLPGIDDSDRVGLNVVSTLAVDPHKPQRIYARAGTASPALLRSSEHWLWFGGSEVRLTKPQRRAERRQSKAALAYRGPDQLGDRIGSGNTCAPQACTTSTLGPPERGSSSAALRLNQSTVGVGDVPPGERSDNVERDVTRRPARKSKASA
jgi:hypothetical protein